MELEPRPTTETYHHLVNETKISNENVVKTIGRDFNKSVANLNGLIALLNEGNTSEMETEQIHRYLTIEVKKLKAMVLNICS